MQHRTMIFIMASETKQDVIYKKMYQIIKMRDSTRKSIIT